jgi:hypothetical protein
VKPYGAPASLGSAGLHFMLPHSHSEVIMIATLQKSLARTSQKPSAAVINRDDLDVEILDALEAHSSGSMCIGSSTGEIHGLAGRVAAIREHSSVSMCFWGGFVK